jgi:hypothetical protein
MVQSEIIRSTISIDAHHATVFDYVFERDMLYFFSFLPHVPLFTYRPLEAYGLRPGFEHRIYFANGNSVRRRLLTYLPGMSFTIVVKYFTIYFLPWLEEIEYRYYFMKSSKGKDQTQIIAEYKFKFRSTLWMAFFNLGTARTIRHYQNAFLNQLQKDCIRDLI